MFYTSHYLAEYGVHLITGGRCYIGCILVHVYHTCTILFLNVGVILYAHINEAVGSRLLKVCSSRVSVGLLEPVYQRESLPLRFIATFVPDT